MKYTIYQIVNNINGKIYVGAHKTTNIDDDYMGSGKILNLAYEKYGIDNFTKQILHVFDSPEKMFKKEAEIVDESFIKRNDTYNLKRGGFGGWVKHKQSPMKGKPWPHKGKTYEEIHGEEKATILRQQMSITHMGINKGKTYEEIYGKKRAAELKKGISEFRKGKTSHCKDRTYEEIYGKSVAMVIKQKRSDEMIGAKNPQYGRCWIYNNKQQISKTIPRNKLKEYLDNGWLKGRKLKW